MALRVQATKNEPGAVPGQRWQPGWYSGRRPLGRRACELAQPLAGARLAAVLSKAGSRCRTGRRNGAAPLLLCGCAAAGAAPRPMVPAHAPGGKRRTGRRSARLLISARPRSRRWRSIGQRSQRIHDTLARLGLPAQVVVADATPGSPMAARARHASLMPSCSMPRARPRASCAATRTCAGCAGPAISPSWPPSKRSSWRRCGRW